MPRMMRRWSEEERRWWTSSLHQQRSTGPTMLQTRDLPHTPTTTTTTLAQTLLDHLATILTCKKPVAHHHLSITHVISRLAGVGLARLGGVLSGWGVRRRGVMGVWRDGGWGESPQLGLRSLTQTSATPPALSIACLLFSPQSWVNYRPCNCIYQSMQKSNQYLVGVGCRMLMIFFSYSTQGIPGFKRI